MPRALTRGVLGRFERGFGRAEAPPGISLLRAIDGDDPAGERFEGSEIKTVSCDQGTHLGSRWENFQLTRRGIGKRLLRR